MSAGKYSSSSIFRISPTQTSFHYTSTSQLLVYGLNLLVFLALVSRSDLYLFKSSYPSRNIEREITNTNGDIAAKGLRGDIDEMDWRMALNKK